MSEWRTVFFFSLQMLRNNKKKTKKNIAPLLRSATGREVFDWILDQGYYSERDTSNVVRQVLEAVAYLHSLQIVHRNLKVTDRRCLYNLYNPHILQQFSKKKKKAK